jgi:hypothetical protein|tara:strand:- start:210 stop:965 length:756 start_codon:yes stop_codon:yes gene_type:complete
LVWKEEWWSSSVETGGGSRWSEFANQSDAFITSGLTITGILLIVLGVTPWMVRFSRFTRLVWLMIPATLIVFVDGFARWVSSGYELGMAIEHVLQIGTPILFLMACLRPEFSRRWIRVALILSAMTFLGHALYAIGFYTVPLNFKMMTQGLLGLSDKETINLLLVAGWLDIGAAVGVFFLATRIPSLIYMIFWGGVTALARVASNFDRSADFSGFDPWLVETLVRTPHWLIPLLIMVLVKRGHVRMALARQ